ncbi:MAG: DUF3800 domain-containing protein [Proteobacteria bacterium]|nr:DUF3800 domain-containing protein [Pseudomonadota bacterium]
MKKTYNIYCDESCHLENDGFPIMVLGGVWCDATKVKTYSDDIRNLKESHNLSRNFELKWTKVSPGKKSLYEDVLKYFFSTPGLKFRGLLIKDKPSLNHQQFNQSHDDWYYKMYFNLLKFIFSSPNKYRIYLDIKDTKGGPKTRKLHEVLANSIFDFEKKSIEKVQQVRSHETELMQITDLLIGAISYSNRNLRTSRAKKDLVKIIEHQNAVSSLNQTSTFSSVKFNLFVWQPNEGSPNDAS